MELSCSLKFSVLRDATGQLIVLEESAKKATTVHPASRALDLQTGCSPSACRRSRTEPDLAYDRQNWSRGEMEEEASSSNGWTNIQRFKFSGGTHVWDIPGELIASKPPAIEHKYGL
ncbi:hypothetical protein SAY87_018777 [Trapa incisa]|uniref:Uncharacterized protein n=1 Tax=Trapa incisa TaxID=236973 RepID=A0AAN7K2G4_9MYRT|nr:hypothetical protein SAY87_018777 [Trapa incisa]